MRQHIPIASLSSFFYTFIRNDDVSDAFISFLSSQRRGNWREMAEKNVYRATISSLRSSSSMDSSDASTFLNDPSKAKPASILFLGTGSSTGCPKPLCALLQDHTDSSCFVSNLAMEGNPKYNKNYRNNPSILISHANDDDTNNVNAENRLRSVIIDVGKTFREGALRWMPSHNKHIDAIVLTHGHADAIGGMDDVRGFQSIIKNENASNRKDKYRVQPIPVFLSDECLQVVSRQFPYLVPDESKDLTFSDSSILKDNKPVVKRHVAALNYHTIEPFEPFLAAGLKIIPLPVKHGEDMICLGFAFSLKHVNVSKRSHSFNNPTNHKESFFENEKKVTNIVYLSDISRMLSKTESFIMEKLPPTDILIIDSLLRHRRHSTHYNLDQAIAMARTLGAKKTYIVGMNCDDFKPHDEMNKELALLDGVSVQLAHDGLLLEFENDDEII